MKRIFTLIVLGMFSAAIAGCEASAKVGDSDTSSDSTVSKKTVESSSPGGDTTYSRTTVTHTP